ncbi:MAG: FecR domain-containing protein [Lachnospiraceae bacterium]|nr:FecR domain-containing protein [Lachnospiraceae bacterium]
MKRKIRIAIVLTLILAFILPDALPSLNRHAQAATGIDVTNVVLKPGKTKKVTISGLGTGFTWTSSNTSVAKVTRKVKADNTATITAKGEGVAVITATKGNNTYQCNVVVMEKAETTDTSGKTATESKSIKDITVFEKSGTVSVVRSKKTVKATKDMKLKNDDYSIVGDDSFLRLCLDDKSYAYFESGTEFAVSKAWFSKVKICMTKGEMILEVQKKLDKEDSVDVITPNTSMSIRGTVVAIKTIPETDGKTTTINYILEGSAEITYKDKKTKKNKTITLKAGEGWETTTNKKGKVVSNKKADASKFDFENIDIDKLQGADGNEMVITLPEGSKKDQDTGKDDKNNNGSGSGSDTGNGSDSENGSDNGSGTGNDPNTGNTSDSGENTDQGTGNGQDTTAPEEDTYEPAVPARFDYDREGYASGDSHEEQPYEDTMIEKDYDISGVLRHKRQSIYSDTWEQSGISSYSITDWYYDSNKVLRVYCTERIEYSEKSNSADNGSPREISYTTETHYSANGVKIFYNSIDESYDTTTWYDDQGREAEYIRMTVSDNKVVEHLIYSYNKNGDKKESPAD